MFAHRLQCLLTTNSRYLTFAFVFGQAAGLHLSRSNSTIGPSLLVIWVFLFRQLVWFVALALWLWLCARREFWSRHFCCLPVSVFTARKSAASFSAVSAGSVVRCFYFHRILWSCLVLVLRWPLCFVFASGDLSFAFDDGVPSQSRLIMEKSSLNRRLLGWIVCLICFCLAVLVLNYFGCVCWDSDMVIVRLTVLVRSWGIISIFFCHLDGAVAPCLVCADCLLHSLSLVEFCTVQFGALRHLLFFICGLRVGYLLLVISDTRGSGSVVASSLLVNHRLLLSCSHIR